VNGFAGRVVEAHEIEWRFSLAHGIHVEGTPQRLRHFRRSGSLERSCRADQEWEAPCINPSEQFLELAMGPTHVDREAIGPRHLEGGNVLRQIGRS